MTSPRRRLLALFALPLALAQSVSRGASLLDTATAREVIRHQLERVYARKLRGALEIGRIRAIDGSFVRASDVQVRDPSGDVVVHARDAELELDALALLGGALRLERVVARGALVRVLPGRHAKTSLEEAFDPWTPRRGRPLEVDTGPMRFEDGTLLVALGPEVRVDDASGFVRVTRHDGAGPRVRLDRVRGRYRGPGARVLDEPRFEADGWIRVRPAGTEVHLDATLALDPPWPVRIDVREGRAHLAVDEDGPPALIAALRVAGVLVGPLEVDDLEHTRSE